MCKSIMYFIAGLYPFKMDNYKLFLMVFLGIIGIIIFTDLNIGIKAKLIESTILIAMPIGVKKWLSMEKNHESFFFNTVCINQLLGSIILFILLIN